MASTPNGAPATRSGNAITAAYPRSSAASRHGANTGSFAVSAITQIRFSRIAVPAGPRPAGESDHFR